MNLILLATSLAVAVTSGQHNKLHIRGDWPSNSTGFPCLYMTNEVNWQGEGQNLCQVGGQCASSLPDGLTANVSSAGPSEGQTCFLYDNENCGGTASPAFSYPGYSDLNTIGFFKKARSWRCYMWMGYTSSISTITRTITQTQTMAQGTALNAASAASSSVSITATLSSPQPTASPSNSAAGSSSANVPTTTEVITETEIVTATKASGTGGSGSASAQASSTGIWNGSSSFSVVMTHTFGGRGGSVTTLTTYMATG